MEQLRNEDVDDSPKIASASGSLNHRASFNTFRDVTQISSSLQGSNTGLAVDMVGFWYISISFILSCKLLCPFFIDDSCNFWLTCYVCSKKKKDLEA